MYKKTSVLRTSWLILLASMLAILQTTAWAQSPSQPSCEVQLAQVTSQLGLITAGRDFSERLAAQAITSLEAQLKQIKPSSSVVKEDKASGKAPETGAPAPTGEKP